MDTRFKRETSEEAHNTTRRCAQPCPRKHPTRLGKLQDFSTTSPRQILSLSYSSCEAAKQSDRSASPLFDHCCMQLTNRSRGFVTATSFPYLAALYQRDPHPPPIISLFLSISISPDKSSALVSWHIFLSFHGNLRRTDHPIGKDGIKGGRMKSSNGEEI